MRPITDADILDALASRSGWLELRAAVRSATQMPAGSPPEICKRWLTLATLLSRFERTINGQTVIDWSAFKGPVASHQLCGDPSVPPSEIEWARALRAATLALLPFLNSGQDVPVHRLVQDIDRLLGRQVVDVAALVREVDVLVRAAGDRFSRAQAEATARATEETDNETQQREAALVREHAGSPAGRAMLQELLRHDPSPVTTQELKQAGIAAVEARQAATLTDRDTTGKKHHGRAVQETLRVFRDRCTKCVGCPPCPDHLGLMITPKRGKNSLTVKGRGFAEKRQRTG